MNKNSRRFITLLSCFIVSILCANCTKEKPNSNGDGGTIKFWHFFSEPSQKDALMIQLNQFEKESGIKVEVSELSWNDGKTKLLAAFNSNTAPDVLELGSDWVAQFSSSGVLSEQIDSAKRFSPEISAPGIWSNKCFALPWVVDTRVLFFNKELLFNSGIDTSVAVTSWDNVLKNSEIVKSKNPDAYGFGSNGPDKHRLYKKIVPFFWSNGGNIFSENGVPVVNSEANIGALQKYIELSRAGLIETQKSLDQTFLQGKIAYWISGSWLVEKIKKDNPKLQFGVSVLPSLKEGSPGVSFAGGEYLAINAKSNEQVKAKKLIDFLTSGKNALAFGKALPGGMTPAELSVSDPFLTTGTRAVFTEQLKNSKMTPVHPKWLDIEEIIEDEVSECLLAQKESKQALDDAQTRIVELLNSK